MQKRIFVIVLILVLFLPTGISFAISTEEKNFLLMYFNEDELAIVSATRSLKSITRVAENVEVVTKEDIELMNAHTLADVLNTVNGIALFTAGASPGSIANTSIQGSGIEHVTVFLDGVRINVPDVADVASVPVQMIEKVEVIKGPASSAWGSSLGGIINVITKAPANPDLAVTVTGSYGEKNSGDFRAEVSGRKGDSGYYLYAGRLQTDGLRPFEEISNDNLYTKLTFDVSRKTNLGFTLFYNQGRREEGDFRAYDFLPKDKTENFLTTLNLNTSLSDGLEMDISLKAARQRIDIYQTILSTGEVMPGLTDDRKYGATAKLLWKQGAHNVVFGSDYDYEKLVTNYLSSVPELNVFALFANDTISLGRLSVIPGLRYDYTDRNMDFWSPSLGITVEPVDKTFLRVYVAKGFHLPAFADLDSDGPFFKHNSNLKPEKVWSYQVGIESGALNYLWVKLSVFRHDITDAIIRQDIDLNAGTWTAVNAAKTRTEGFEAAMRTMKVYNFSGAFALAYMKSRDIETGETLHDWPDYTYDLSLKYEDERSFRALLKGRYDWWDQTAENLAKYNAFIFDLNVITKLIRNANRSCEVFFTAHNLFNGTQFAVDPYINARRWIEAGVRYKF